MALVEIGRSRLDWGTGDAQFLPAKISKFSIPAGFLTPEPILEDHVHCAHTVFPVDLLALAIGATMI